MQETKYVLRFAYNSEMSRIRHLNLKRFKTDDIDRRAEATDNALSFSSELKTSAEISF